MTSRDYTAEASALAANLKSIIKDIVADLQAKEATIEQLKTTIQEQKTSISELKGETSDIGELRSKNKALQEELDGIREQLEKMSETYRELVSVDEGIEIPVQELLALYLSLLEEVFGAQPHAKALFMLHGQKQEMTRTEIVKAAGHEAAAIRKALGDLSRAGLIEYDIERDTARLVKRIYR
jgi:chromosome segregation ATPase